MAKNDEVKIDSITLKIAGATLRLTLDEARRLHEALGGLFPSCATPQVVPLIVTYPDYWRTRPWWSEPWVCSETTSGCTTLCRDDTSLVCTVS